MIIRIITPLSRSAAERLDAAAKAGTLPARMKLIKLNRYQVDSGHPGDLALVLMNIAGERFKFEILPER